MNANLDDLGMPSSTNGTRCRLAVRVVMTHPDAESRLERQAIRNGAAHLGLAGGIDISDSFGPSWKPLNSCWAFRCGLGHQTSGSPAPRATVTTRRCRLPVLASTKRCLRRVRMLGKTGSKSAKAYAAVPLCRAVGQAVVARCGRLEDCNSDAGRAKQPGTACAPSARLADVSSQ